MKKILLFILLSLLVQTSRAQVIAPDFSVVDTEGNTHHLYDYLDDGKIVVLDFFYVGCSYCEYYSVHIQESYENFGCNNADVVFLGIDWNDNDSEVQTFDSTFGLEYPSASGLDGGADTVISLYNINYFTTLLVIGSNKQVLKNIKPPTTANIDSFLVLVGAQFSPCNVGITDNEAIENSIELLTNPILQTDLITVYNTESQTYELRLFSMQGKELYHEDIRLKKGINSLPLNVNLKQGIYIVSFEKKGKFQSFKLIVI